MHRNQLIHETSPYLLQHAHNPVDWLPWSPAALERARQADRPVLLSIGYSACHWCHVMERESFEDADTARYMNEHFVCIKVDREERPDIDKIYQTAHQMLNQRPGGWPLTVFMTPQDQAPFFIGTYFPDQPRHGMPAFREILERVREYYVDNRDALTEHAAALSDAIRHMQREARGAGQLGQALLDRAMRELIRQYDRVNGGFGQAPKFPHPGNLEFCLRYWARSTAAGDANPRPLHIARHTLQAMARGGIFDQLGGGFCRYSVDASWQIPHFEKMLYDNAQLLPLYADAWIATADHELRVTAERTADWVLGDMQAEDGGYYSTLDADSEGEEGRFYVWTRDEVAAVLDESEYPLAARAFGLDAAANFEGRWHLVLQTPLADLAEQFGVDPQQAGETLDRARMKLLARRAQRVHPGRDDKVLTAWNGLMIRGMARAGRLLQRRDLIASAERALSFLRRALWRDGRLLATSRDGKSHLNAYLDDHVFVIDGILELLQCRWRSDDLAFALALAELVLDRFEDRDRGAMYFTSDDHEQLLYRDKPAHDDALPAGNGVAALVLQRLGHLTGEPRYLAAAARTLEALAPAIERYPSGHASLLAAVDEHLDPPQIIVLRGTASQTAPWQHACLERYAPRRLVFAIPDDDAELPGILSQRTNIGTVTAYICEGLSCRQPITELARFQQQI